VPCDWLLVDGSSLIFRAYYGVPASVRSPDGRPVNAVRGFLDALSRLVTTRQPQRLAIASDEDWRPQWRVELIPSYKAHRTAEPMPPGLIPQMPIIQDVLYAIGVDFIGLKDYEAEDVIASWAAKASGSVEIASGDRDLFALIEDPRVSVLYPEKSGLVQVTEAEVTRRYGVPGRKYADFAILRGDPSDGLPGLKGVGAVAAASLIRKHGGVAGILSDGALSDAAREYLARALRVVPPVADLPVALPEGRRASYPAHPDQLAALSETHGIRAAGDRLVAVLSAGGAEPVVDP
jgi:5'-3' exonuclease